MDLNSFFDSTVAPNSIWSLYSVRPDRLQIGVWSDKEIGELGGEVLYESARVGDQTH
jgi:hypothetical protein